MTVFKIISLLAVLILSFIELRRENARIKWIGMALCISIFAIGVTDLLVSEKQRENFENTVKRDATRINWEKTKATLHIMNEVQQVSEGAQQVVVKVVPADLSAVGRIQLSDVLGRAVSYGYPRKYISESDAKSLWNALAKDEAKFGIEHIYFHEERLEKDPFQGTRSTMSVSYEPRVDSVYGSLHDLNNTILLARFVAGVSGPALLDRVTLDLRTRAGLSTVTFPAKQLKNDSLVTDSVRYVGVVLETNEF